MSAEFHHDTVGSPTEDEDFSPSEELCSTRHCCMSEIDRENETPVKAEKAAEATAKMLVELCTPQGNGNPTVIERTHLTPRPPDEQTQIA